jgi:hypothetical protein
MSNYDSPIVLIAFLTLIKNNLQRIKTTQRIKFQITKNKFQNLSTRWRDNFQTSISADTAHLEFGHCALEIIWNLMFEIWVFKQSVGLFLSVGKKVSYHILLIELNPNAAKPQPK